MNLRDLGKALLDKTDLDEKAVGFIKNQAAKPIRVMGVQTPITPQQVANVGYGFGKTIATGIGNSLYQAPNYLLNTLPGKVNLAQQSANTYLQQAQNIANAQNNKTITPETYRLAMQGLTPSNNTINRLQQEAYLARNQAAKKSLTGGIQTALTGLGLGSGTAALGSVGLSGALSGAMAKIQGQNVPEAVGTGMAKGLQFAGVNRLTAPVIDPIVEAVGKGKPLVQRLVARGLAQGGLNTAEDNLTSLGMEGRLSTADENILSFVVGSITSPLTKYDPNNSFFEVTDKGISGINKQYIRNKLGQFAKANNIDPKFIDKKTGEVVEWFNKPVLYKNANTGESFTIPRWQGILQDPAIGNSTRAVDSKTGARLTNITPNSAQAPQSDIKAKSLNFLQQSESPNDAVKRIQLLEQKAGGDKKNLAKFKQALKEWRKTLVTGPGLPQHPDNVPVIKEIDRITTGVKFVKPTTAAQTPQLNTQSGIIPPVAKMKTASTTQTQQPGLPVVQTANKSLAVDQSSESIIAEARKQIGKQPEPGKQTIKQSLDSVYTQWVDRFHPIVKASEKAKATLKTQGAMLRPENDPEYLVRRLTGAGGIADARFRRELEPVIKQLDDLKIDKTDMDVYLANKRMAGFGQAGREIYGADPIKSQQVVSALEVKYPGIKELSDQLYQYQDKGFQEMIDAGFISPEVASQIRSKNPDYAPLQRVMDEASDYLGLPTRKTMQGTQPITKIKGSKRQIISPLESIIGNTFTQRAAIEKNRVAKSIVGLQNVVDLGFQKVAKSDNDTITIWNNGQKEYWQVGSEIAEVAKGVNEEQINLVLKIIQAPASLLRQGATGRNPEFMLPNIIRDQLDAGISSKYGYIPVIDYVSGLKSMLQDDEVYKAWERSGAKIDLGEMTGKKSISQYFDEKTARKGLFSWLSTGLDVMGKFSEQPTRVGLFKKAYKATGNELLAAMESRDATVDFARMGSKMKVANSIIPFLNVGVQGFDKLIRSVKNNPGKVLLNASIYGATPAIATTIYNLTNHPEEYAEIPQYEKDSNFVLIKGRNAQGTVDYVTIPKGNILPVIANPIQSFLEYAANANQQSFGEMALSLLSETLPVLSGGSTPKEIAIKTIGSNIPQAVKPLAENLLNKSFYKFDSKKEQNKDIVPYFLQKRPAYQQKYDFTPQMYQKIGAVLDVSPLKVQNLMEGYLAGYSKIPAQAVEMLTKASRNEEINTNEKTILRRFIKQTYPGSNKPAEPKPESPGLMERVTGKASAAESKPLTGDKLKWAIEDEKYRMKSGNKKVSKVGERVLIAKDNGDIETIDTTFQPTPPELTGNTELDKKLKSKFSGEITSKANDLVKLYQAGVISKDEAEQQLKALDELKTKLTPKKGKKPKAITIKAMKPKKLTMRKTQLKAIKAPNLKTIKPKKFKVGKIKY